MTNAPTSTLIGTGDRNTSPIAATESSKRSRIILLASVLLASTLSFSANAEDSKRQQRLNKDISREIPDRVDSQSHRRHAARNSSPQREESTRRPARNRDDKNPAVRRFQSKNHADQIPNSAQIKKRVYKQQRQINQLQRKTERQQKQINRQKSHASNNQRDHRRQNTRKDRHHDANRNRDRYQSYSDRKHYVDRAKRKWVKAKFADHRRIYNAQYGKSHRAYKHKSKKHNYWKNNSYRNYRTFGRSYYPASGLIYSYQLRGNSHTNKHHRGYVWDRIETFYTPSKRHDYDGEEIVIDVNERVRTIQLVGKKRRMFIEAAHVEFGNGEVRRLPELEGMLYDNDVVDFHFRDSRYVVAIYLDVAANDGRKGKASLSVLKSRSRH